jgi:hypothetical protein
MLQIIFQVLLMALLFWLLIKFKRIASFLDPEFRKMNKHLVGTYEKFKENNEYSFLKSNAIEESNSSKLYVINFENPDLFEAKYEEDWKDLYNIARTSVKYGAEIDLIQVLKGKQENIAYKFLIKEVEDVASDSSNYSGVDNSSEICVFSSKRRYIKYLITTDIASSDIEYLDEQYKKSDNTIEYETSLVGQTRYRIMKEFVQKVKALNRKKEEGLLTQSKVDSEYEQLELWLNKKLNEKDVAITMNYLSKIV